ncbi:hypothetical protein [Gordonia oryzae]|uniref:hypothetical protein n=1 Tax=Gordonia oryzae TaxID=2487349 RepID=UPI0016217F70|nr:hypothetical protein [Gordonia oryzae]
MSTFVQPRRRKRESVANPELSRSMPATFTSLRIGITIGALVAEIGTPGDRGRRA